MPPNAASPPVATTAPATPAPTPAAALAALVTPPTGARPANTCNAADASAADAASELNPLTMRYTSPPVARTAERPTTSLAAALLASDILLSPPITDVAAFTIGVSQPSFACTVDFSSAS